MTNTTKTILGIIVLALIIWGVVLFSKPQPAQGKPIKIGVVASMTGPGAFYGENIQKGVGLAVEEINASGGVLGRPIEVIYEDDETNPQKTVSAARKLLSIDGVIVLLGVQWVECSL